MLRNSTQRSYRNFSFRACNEKGYGDVGIFSAEGPKKLDKEDNKDQNRKLRRDDRDLANDQDTPLLDKVAEWRFTVFKKYWRIVTLSDLFRRLHQD